MYLPKKIFYILYHAITIGYEFLILNQGVVSVSQTLQVYILLASSTVLVLLLKGIRPIKINNPAAERPIYNKILSFSKLIKKYYFKYRLVILLASLVTLFLLIEPTVYLITYLGYLTVLLIFLCKVVKILKYKGDRLNFD
ncbi:MAG: hypothetical protein EOP34_02250 [Rickettsiales bacterium]|nr:MAG: hypothetical protein EOP34_02250 [Rickettsiales bacterium]